MKRCLLLTCCIVLFASWASAEIGALCVYTDESGSNCSFVDNGGLVQVYIIHQYADGVSASQFKLDVAATGWTHLGDTWNYPVVIGSSITGVSVGYGGCYSSPFVVGVVSFMGSAAPAGTGFGIVPYPAVGEIQAVDCDGYTRVAAGGTAYINTASPCECETNQTPELEVMPESLDFGYIDVTRELTITNRGGGTLTWDLSESEDWLSLSTTAGTDRQTVTATVDRTGLAQGNYSGAISVTSNGGSETVPVMMTVAPTDPVLRVAPTTLDFASHLTALTLHIFNDGGSGLVWDITSDQPWLTVTPASGVDGSDVSVMVDRSGLAHGSYSGNLTVTSNAGSEIVAVTMTVLIDPVLHVEPDTLNFGNSNLSIPLWIYNHGAAGLVWDVTSDQPWLTVTPASGTEDGQVTAAVDRSGFPAGTYYGNLTVNSNGGNKTVPVTMIVGPVLSYSPTSFTFEWAGNRILSIANAGPGQLQWIITSDRPWLSVVPASGVGNADVTVSASYSGADPGWNNGYLNIASNGGNASVRVSFRVPSPELSVSPDTLNFYPDIYQLYLDIRNLGGGDLTWVVENYPPRISVSNDYGVNDEIVTVWINRTGMLPGYHELSPIVLMTDVGDRSIQVRVWVEDFPVLSVSPSTLSFGTDTLRTLTVDNAGTTTLEWQITSNAPWLTATPAFGTDYAVVDVLVDRTGLADGAYSSSLSITSNGGDESVPVDIWVGNTPVLAVAPLLLSYAPDDTTHSFSIANSGGGSLDWTLSTNRPWIEIVPPLSGTGDATVTVNVDPASVPAGAAQTGTVTVNSNGGDATVDIRYIRETTFTAGTICIFSDAGGTSCDFVDTGDLVPVYFFHNNTNGATASQWRLSLGQLPWTHLGDTMQFPAVVGTTVDGILIGYGGCESSPIFLGVANFLGSTAPACSILGLVPDPAAPSGQIEAVDCLQSTMFPTGQHGRVNPDGTCSCGNIPVRHTTWGAIKALYAPDED
jgi:hypothetical protein